MLCHASIGLELKNRNGKTALILAANKTSYETLKVKKLNVRATLKIIVFKVIVNCGANVNARDDNKRTALHHAAMSCNYDEAEVGGSPKLLFTEIECVVLVLVEPLR